VVCAQYCGTKASSRFCGGESAVVKRLLRSCEEYDLPLFMCPSSQICAVRLEERACAVLQTYQGKFSNKGRTCAAKCMIVSISSAARMCVTRSAL
jgi:hypothetical protein